ncbi:MAG: hypothetical protein ACI82A_001780 [Candidatus Azotimanducaceae bacterium]|jgi:hypothetical protein
MITLSELEVDFDDNDDDVDTDAKIEEPRVVLASMDTRRKIEEMLERKRLREEFGDIDFD